MKNKNYEKFKSKNKGINIINFVIVIIIFIGFFFSNTSLSVSYYEDYTNNKINFLSDENYTIKEGDIVKINRDLWMCEDEIDLDSLIILSPNNSGFLTVFVGHSAPSDLEDLYLFNYVIPGLWNSLIGRNIEDSYSIKLSPMEADRINFMYISVEVLEIIYEAPNSNNSFLSGGEIIIISFALITGIVSLILVSKMKTEKKTKFKKDKKRK